MLNILSYISQGLTSYFLPITGGSNVLLTFICFNYEKKIKLYVSNMIKIKRLRKLTPTLKPLSTKVATSEWLYCIIKGFNFLLTAQLWVIMLIGDCDLPFKQTEYVGLNLPQLFGPTGPV